MSSFLKFFLASMLALIVFTGLGFLFLLFTVSMLNSAERPDVGSKAVLEIDLDQRINEQGRQNPFGALNPENQYDFPGLYDVVRMIRHAKGDSSVKGIYIKCNGNVNGYATSEELRNALLDFKQSKKFVFAYGDVISQKAYYVANAADRIYCNPKGGLEWKGLGVDYVFFKQALDKLEIEPQVFYAGKFKSATEPFRQDHMSEPNRVQTLELIRSLYDGLLVNTSKARGVDTSALHQYADQLMIQTTNDAVKYKLLDAAKYDDEVQDEIRQRLKVDSNRKINFVPLGKYAKAVNFRSGSGSNRIALIYAEGDIINGRGERDQIGGDSYKDMIRKARMDKNIKAIVLRVNSGGGSALASEIIWREIAITKKEKPVILSFGDVAASGGYYIAANADSIFAQPNTITGSIGVFAIVPNMQNFMKNKLGVTFDGVKTTAHADMMSAVKPLSDPERRFIQNEVDTIYQTFLSRVASGREMSIADADSIGQGRVWTGRTAVRLGLVDKLGSLQDAIDCAARMADVEKYRVREFPEPQGLLQMLLGTTSGAVKTKLVKDEMGEEEFRLYTSLKKIRQYIGITQTRMPFEIRFN